MIVKSGTKDYWNLLKTIKNKDKIFFNGCFDIIHLGHLSLINKAKRIIKDDWVYSSDAIIIAAINSDNSFNKQNKSHKLINDEIYRATFLKMLGIDYVIIFDEMHPEAIIKEIQPKTIIKGSDYKEKEYPEKQLILDMGIIIEYINILGEYSTTNIYERIRSL